MRLLWITALCCAVLVPEAAMAQSSGKFEPDPAAKGLASPDFIVTGDARISGDVVVAGALMVGGGVDLGLFYVEESGGEVSFLRAFCPSGSRVISGGCRTSDSSISLSTSYPEGPNDWTCAWTSTTGNKSAIVLCAPE